MGVKTVFKDKDLCKTQKWPVPDRDIRTGMGLQRKKIILKPNRYDTYKFWANFLYQLIIEKLWRDLTINGKCSASWLPS